MSNALGYLITRGHVMKARKEAFISIKRHYHSLLVSGNTG